VAMMMLPAVKAAMAITMIVAGCARPSR
jgi:hypothetical protein